MPKYKLYPFPDQKGPKAIHFGAANICLSRAWLCRFKVLFGSQYRARSPLSGVSDKLECNPKLLNDSTSCNQIWGNIDIAQMHRSFSVRRYGWEDLMGWSDFNCAAPVSPGREITVPCFLSARPSPVSDVFVRSEIWRFLWSGGSSQSLDGQLPTTDPDTDP